MKYEHVTLLLVPLWLIVGNTAPEHSWLVWAGPITASVAAVMSCISFDK